VRRRNHAQPIHPDGLGVRRIAAGSSCSSASKDIAAANATPAAESIAAAGETLSNWRRGELEGSTLVVSFGHRVGREYLQAALTR